MGSAGPSDRGLPPEDEDADRPDPDLASVGRPDRRGAARRS